MKRLQTILIVISFAFLGASCSEDVVSTFGSVYGIVTDAQTGELLQNVSVSIAPGNETMVTGADGHYEFTELDAGQHKITVALTEYQDNSMPIEIIPGKRVCCDIAMSKVVYQQKLNISPTNLNFGVTQSQLSLTITNLGTESTPWALYWESNNWLSASPKSGNIAACRTQSIIFTVNRDMIAEEKQVVVNISAFDNSYPVSVMVKPEQKHSEMNITPTTLNFGDDLTELTLNIQNIGNESLSWYIDKLAIKELSFSKTSGVVAAGGSTAVKVLLDRSSMNSDLNTSFVVSDGVKDVSVAVNAVKKILKSEMKVTPTTLDFGLDVEQLPLTISNIGTAPLNWTMSGLASYLSASLTKGSIAEGGKATIYVVLDRSRMPESVDTTLSISDGTSSVTVLVSATKGKAILDVSPTSINFGESESTQRFTVSNTGTAEPSWSLKNINTDCLTFLPSSGVITPGGSKSVEVTLNRGIMPASLDTSVTVTCGTMEKKVSIKGQKPEDYSSATIQSCDNRIVVEIESCKRSGGTVVFTYKLTNVGMGYIRDWRIYPTNSQSLMTGCYRSTVADNLGNEYFYSLFSFRNESSKNYVVGTEFPDDMTCKGSVTVYDVDERATKLTIMLGVAVYNHSSNLADNRIYFKNVPIY